MYRGVAAETPATNAAVNATRGQVVTYAGRPAVTYFFPADPILESLASFSVAGVAIDVRSRDTTAFERLDAFRSQTVVLGAVDARNTRLETAAEVAGYVERALRLVPQDRLWIAPTTSLEYLPRNVARAKLAALVHGARSAAGQEVLA